MIDKTKNLIKRRWADIDFFITTEPDKFQNIADIEIITLQEFLIGFMDKDRGRKLLEEFWCKTEREKWE